MPSQSALQSDLATLRHARVYFNHHSVGFNLLDGVRRLDPTLPVRHLSRDDTAKAGPGFIDTNLGTNGDPRSKWVTFAETLARLPEPPTVALTKLCFVDFTPSTDVAALFREYKTQMAELEARYPTTRFVHVTVPLVVKKPKWKVLIKDVLGKPEDADLNERREAFSALVRQHYPAHRVFDLALFEATREDGSLEQFERNGKQLPALAAAYSSDGAHLNQRGQDVLARRLVHSLAAAARSQ